MIRSLIYTIFCLIFLLSQGCKGCGDDDNNRDTAVKPTFEYDVQKKGEKQAKKNGSDLITPEIDDLLWEEEQEEKQEGQPHNDGSQQIHKDSATTSQETVPELETTQAGTVDETVVPVQKTSVPEKKTQDTSKAKENMMASKAPIKKSKEPVSTSPKQDTKYKPVFSNDGMFIVQVASFKKKRNAVNLVGKLKTQGYPVFVDLHETSDGTFYRVRIGNFDSRSGAETFREKVLLVHGYKSSWVDTIK